MFPKVHDSLSSAYPITSVRAIVTRLLNNNRINSNGRNASSPREPLSLVWLFHKQGLDCPQMTWHHARMHARQREWDLNKYTFSVALEVKRVYLDDALVRNSFLRIAYWCKVEYYCMLTRNTILAFLNMNLNIIIPFSVETVSKRTSISTSCDVKSFTWQ